MKLRSSFETKVLAAFAAAMLVVAGLAAATWEIADEAAQASRWVTHTLEVLDGVVRTRSDTLQIEFSTQGYRITGDPARLAEREAAINSRESQLDRIRELTADNPGQQERWAELRDVTNKRRAISDRVVQLRQTRGAQAATAYAASAPLQETRARAYQLLREMEAEERSLLASRTARQLQARQDMVLAGSLISLLLLALLTASYLLIRRQLRKTQASQRALAESEESLFITLHSIGDAVLATDTQGLVTRMNPVAEQLTGWPLALAQGRPIEEVFRVVHEKTQQPVEIPVTKVLASGKIQGLALHTALIARDGRQHPIADSAAPICDVTGRVSGVVLVFRDVTLERQAQRTIREQNELLERRVQERTAQLQESQDHLRNVISAVPAMIAYVDAGQRYVYVNEQYRERFAPGQTDITGRTVREILGDERYAIAAPLIAKALKGLPQNYDWQPFPDVWQVINYVPKSDAQHRTIGYYVLGSDITERKRDEKKIRALNAELERRLLELGHVSRALRTQTAGNRTVLRATDEQGLLDSMCRNIVEEGGYNMAVVWYRAEDGGATLRPMAEHGYPEGLDALRKLKFSWSDHDLGRGVVGTAIRTGQTVVIQDMLADPSYAPLRHLLRGQASGMGCPLRVNGGVIGAIAIYGSEAHTFNTSEVALLTELADDLAFGITTLRARIEQHKTQQAIHRMTYYDALTGLPNEVQFSEQLKASTEAHRRLGHSFALLQINIERLSEINDTLGFSHGDQLLREFAVRLIAVAPVPAKVARLRGDEFAILLPDSDTPAAVAMVQRVEDALAQPFPIADIPLDVSAKIGVVLFPAHGSTPHDLYRHMDIAMRQAKKKGLRHVVFDPAQSQQQPHRLALAGELRRAIESGDLQLHLQPKVDMATGRVCGAEGLVRWNHPTHGLIPPVEFIHLAEHTGLINPLTEWVIDAALRLGHVWQSQGQPQPIAVNLSARNLRDEQLLKKIRHLQSLWGELGGLLEIELTESTIMEDAEFALRVLHDLHKEGLRLYIDDFGTGYSSLGYLQKLPVDYIKIDQSFVRAMRTSKDSEIIVRMTIDLAHDIGRKVVAEGVETREQWDQLVALGCDLAQGYFIARPMPAEDFREWITRFRPPVHTPGGG